MNLRISLREPKTKLRNRVELEPQPEVREFRRRGDERDFQETLRQTCEENVCGNTGSDVLLKPNYDVIIIKTMMSNRFNKHTLPNSALRGSRVRE